MTAYTYDVLRQSCPECRSGNGERCLDLRALRTGRQVANERPHGSRVRKAAEFAKVRVGALRRAGR